MICYKDKIWCPYWMLCKNGHGCDRAYTPDVQKAAEQWWGGKNAPVQMYGSFPDCFVPFFDNSFGGGLGKKE